MALLLSLETSTQVFSVALHRSGELISYQMVSESRSAASQLAVCIQQVLNKGEVSAHDLQGVVVASGPGSFTGLRIGVATAKGLCYSLEIPLVAVNTLDLLASQVLHEMNHDPDFLLCPMIDARRMEVYCKLVDSKLQEVEPTQAKIIDEASFDKYLDKQEVYFFGDGSAKCRESIASPRAKFLDDVVPKASHLGVLGFSKWKASQFENVTTFEPNYLKDFLIRKPIGA